MESATANIRCKFVVADFLATEIPLLKLATDYPLLLDELFTISNGLSVADYMIFNKLIFYLFIKMT